MNRTMIEITPLAGLDDESCTGLYAGQDNRENLNDHRQTFLASGWSCLLCGQLNASMDRLCLRCQRVKI